MRFIKLSMQFVAFVMLFIFLACAPSTKFSAISKDEAYQGHPGKIMVVNAFQDPATRRLFEDEFVRVIKDQKGDAVASYVVMPELVVSDTNAIAAQANAVGADTLLINVPLGTTTTSTGNVSSYQNILHIKTRTDVIDMKSNRFIMTISAETRVLEGQVRIVVIQSYIKDLVNKLSEAGLF
jgi:hypothetical protein